jgi:hypothetical protein
MIVDEFHRSMKYPIFCETVVFHDKNGQHRVCWTSSMIRGCQSFKKFCKMICQKFDLSRLLISLGNLENL